MAVPLDALATIASVSAVVWTGALIFIAFAIRRRDEFKAAPAIEEAVDRWKRRIMILEAAMNLLQTAFMSALILMVASPAVLHVVAGLLGVIYLALHTAQFGRITGTFSRPYKVIHYATDFAILTIAVYPHPVLATAITIAALFFGYQTLLLLIPDIIKTEER